MGSLFLFDLTRVHKDRLVFLIIRCGKGIII